MQEEGILELDRRQILVKDQEKWSYICKVTYVTEESPGFLYDVSENKKTFAEI